MKKPRLYNEATFEDCEEINDNCRVFVKWMLDVFFDRYDKDSIEETKQLVKDIKKIDKYFQEDLYLVFLTEYSWEHNPIVYNQYQVYVEDIEEVAREFAEDNFKYFCELEWEQ